MSPQDPRIDAYIARAEPFARPILELLRERVHEACPQIEETMKWRAPSFLYGGRILCGMAAFSRHASFGFWQHAQVMGEGVERDGMGSFGRMTTLRDVPSPRRLAPLLRKAMRQIDTATTAPRVPRATRVVPELPPDLAAALQRNAPARRGFEALPPSHRREYIEWLIEARREATRTRRLQQALVWIAEGKSRHWKYARR
jgi:hypothetical protein